MNKKIRGLIFILIFYSGSVLNAETMSDGLYAQINTNKGPFVVSLEFEKTPMTVANFVGLSEGTIHNTVFAPGIPFYRGSIFHRVVPDHVIQAGAPAKEGRTDPGYYFPNEIHPALSHNRAGMLGMANSGPHTNGSQFYITLSDRSYLDNDYTVFGQVVKGMDVVMAIRQGDLIENILIIRQGSKAKKFQVSTRMFKKQVAQNWKKINKNIRRQKITLKHYLKRKWPQLIGQSNGIQYIIQKNGQGNLPTPPSQVKVRYQGMTLLGNIPFYSSTDGSPQSQSPGQIFTVTLGQGKLIKGLEDSILSMRQGEKRLVVIPPALAYNKSGFYGKAAKGEKRFVISPNTTCVFEIELIEINP